MVPVMSLWSNAGFVSAATSVCCGISQEYVIGPILINTDTPDLVRLIERHGLRPHFYVDDTQLYAVRLLQWATMPQVSLRDSKTDFI
jgi:hypothetical protein